MKPHRPIDLDSLNEEFFPREEKDIEPEITDDGADDNDEVDAAAGFLEMLKSVTISEENPVFHDIDEEDADSDTADTSTSEKEKIKVIVEDAAEGVSEEDALNSFPDFEFNPEAFIVAEDAEKVSENDTARIIKESVEEKEEDETELSEEELKEQKKLERKVSRPFRIRRLLSFIMFLFLIAGIIAVAFEGALYKIGNKAETRLRVGEYSVCYIEPENIESSCMGNSVAVFRKEIVSGNKTILFPYNEKYMVEEVVAVGSGICAVKIPGTDSPITVSNSDVAGIMIYSIKNIRGIYYAVHNNTVIVLVADALYFALVICLFLILIRRQNKKIDKYNEEFQIVK